MIGGNDGAMSSLEFHVLLVSQLVRLMSARALGSLLYEVAPVDPATYAGMSAAMIVVGLLASYVPALRAARVDPMESLRSDRVRRSQRPFTEGICSRYIEGREPMLLWITRALSRWLRIIGCAFLAIIRSRPLAALLSTVLRRPSTASCAAT